MAVATDITTLTALDLSAAIRDRRASCVEVMQAYLAKIDRLNPDYLAIVSLRDTATLLAEAAAADQALARGEYRGWMHGMPHAVKDLANAAGLATSFGSQLYAGTMAQADDIHIGRIRAAGAIFIGKTNVPEFGMGSQTWNTVFGTTRNAWRRDLTAGGSSGGAAAGLALGLLPVADGSDMMGSLRNPAAFNHVVGFRPTQGRVPATSDDLFYQQLSTDGPMGRNVADLAALYGTLAGADPRAPLSAGRPPGPPVPGPTAGLRIGWLGDLEGYLAMEPGVTEVVEAALARLLEHGCHIEPAGTGFAMERVWSAWLTLRQYAQCHRQPLLEDAAARAALKPEIIWEIEASLGLTARAVSDAGLERTAWYRAAQRLFERFDFLALPAAQVFPFPADVHWPAAVNGRTMDTYHRWMEVVLPASLAGLPAISLPAGFAADGRPMGVQIIGPHGADERVLSFALAWEAVTGSALPRPPAASA